VTVGVVFDHSHQLGRVKTGTEDCQISTIGAGVDDDSHETSTRSEKVRGILDPNAGVIDTTGAPTVSANVAAVTPESASPKYTTSSPTVAD
jgi:hypothetical protein